MTTGTTRHSVAVSRSELARLAPAHNEPARLVEESFRFLLEREPASSILRRFAISEVERYFPDYPDWITDRLAPADRLAEPAPYGQRSRHHDLLLW